jgi:PhnB protein
MSNGKIGLGPYINFQGRARDAMAFYQKVLGGTVDLRAATEQGASKPAGPGDRIMHAQLEADGAFITGSNGHPKYAPTVGDNMAIALQGIYGDRINRIFNGLAEGGKVKGKIAPQLSGGSTGYLVDPFGINWVVTINKA